MAWSSAASWRVGEIVTAMLLNEGAAMNYLNFGHGTPTILHGSERVITEQEQEALMSNQPFHYGPAQEVYYNGSSVPTIVPAEHVGYAHAHESSSNAQNGFVISTASGPFTNGSTYTIGSAVTLPPPGENWFTGTQVVPPADLHPEWSLLPQTDPAVLLGSAPGGEWMSAAEMNAYIERRIMELMEDRIEDLFTQRLAKVEAPVEGRRRAIALDGELPC